MRGLVMDKWRFAFHTLRCENLLGRGEPPRFFVFSEPVAGRRPASSFRDDDALVISHQQEGIKLGDASGDVFAKPPVRPNPRPGPGGSGPAPIDLTADVTFSAQLFCARGGVAGSRAKGSGLQRDVRRRLSARFNGQFTARRSRTSGAQRYRLNATRKLSAFSAAPVRAPAREAAPARRLGSHRPKARCGANF